MLSASQIIVYFVVGLVVVRYLVGALYDIQVSFAQLKFLKQVKARVSKRVPRTTFVLFGQFDPNKITENLQKNLSKIKKLKNVDLLFIDNASNNGSLAKARRIAKENKAHLKVVTVKTKLKSSEQVFRRIKRNAKGSIVVLLPARADISASSIIRLQQLFSTQPKLVAFHLQELLTAPRSNLNVFKIFSKISNKRYSNRLHTSENSCIAVRKRNISSRGEVKNVLNFVVSPKKYPVYYTLNDDDYIHYDRHVDLVRFKSIVTPQTFSTKVYDVWAAGSFMAESFVYLYALYLAIAQNVYEPLIIGYALVTGCYTYALVLQDGYSAFEKLKLSVYVPVLFLLELVRQILIQPTATIWTLANNTKTKQPQPNA